VLVAGSDGKGVMEMVESIARKMGTDAVPNIDELYKPTLDEISRQRFVSALRKHVLVDKASEMKESFETIVKPAMRKSDKEFPKDGPHVKPPS
jgi:hypothetical protein